MFAEHMLRIEFDECDMWRDYHAECRVYTPDSKLKATKCSLCMRRSVDCVDLVCFQFSPLCVLTISG